MIVAIHELDYRLPDKTLILGESVSAVKTPTSGEMYLPRGVNLPINTREKKLRSVEKIGDVYVERFFIQADRRHQSADLNTVMVRIHDKDYPKVLINRDGISEVVKNWTNGGITSSTFINDIYLGIINTEYDKVLSEFIYDTVGSVADNCNSMNCYYQNEASDDDNIVRYYRSLYQDMISDYYSNMRYGWSSNTDLAIGKYMDIDTGKLPQIDPLSWLSKEGGLGINDLRVRIGKLDPIININPSTVVDIDKKCIAVPLNFAEYPDLVNVLQYSPCTEYKVRYILLNGEHKPRKEIHKAVSRYGWSQIVSELYFDDLGFNCFKSWHTASEITVEMTWNHDVYIKIHHNDGNVSNYYVDLVTAALATMSLVHY